MTQLIAKLLVLIAVMLMPFGMAPGGASANWSQAMTAGMPMQHCPEQGSEHDMKSGFADCAMACSAALPARDLPQAEHLLIIAGAPIALGAQRELRGLHPDTAIPPPKVT